MEALARGRRGLREPEPGEPERVSAGGRAGDGGPGRTRRAQSPLAATRRGSALRGFEPRPRGRSERCCRWQRFPAASSAPAVRRTEGRVVDLCTSARRSARVSGTSCGMELRAGAFAVFGRGGLWRRRCVERGAPSRDPWGPSPLRTALPAAFCNLLVSLFVRSSLVARPSSFQQTHVFSQDLPAGRESDRTSVLRAALFSACSGTRCELLVLVSNHVSSWRCTTVSP